MRAAREAGRAGGQARDVPYSQQQQQQQAISRFSGGAARRGARLALGSDAVLFFRRAEAKRLRAQSQQRVLVDSGARQRIATTVEVDGFTVLKVRPRLQQKGGCTRRAVPSAQPSPCGRPPRRAPRLPDPRKTTDRRERIGTVNRIDPSYRPFVPIFESCRRTCTGQEEHAPSRRRCPTLHRRAAERGCLRKQRGRKCRWRGKTTTIATSASCAGMGGSSFAATSAPWRHTRTVSTLQRPLRNSVQAAPSSSADTIGAASAGRRRGALLLGGRSCERACAAGRLCTDPSAPRTCHTPPCSASHCIPLSPPTAGASGRRHALPLRVLPERLLR